MQNFRYIVAGTAKAIINISILQKNKFLFKEVVHNKVKFNFAGTIQPNISNPKQHEISHEVVGKA
jgi:hypothetical protein